MYVSKLGKLTLGTGTVQEISTNDISFLLLPSKTMKTFEQQQTFLIIYLKSDLQPQFDLYF